MSSLHQRRHPRFAPAFALLAGLSALPASAADSDFRVIGGLSLQEKSHSFSLPFPVTSRQTTYNLAIGGTTRGIYALVELEKPFSQYTTIHPHATAPYVINVTREDNTLTIGYNLWRNLSLFLGRKSGTTEFNSTRATGESVRLEFDEQGTFAGASYSFDFGARGQLGLSFAYADLPTTLTKTRLDSTFVVESAPGTTSGNSYGIKWTGPLADRLDYHIGFKRNNYRFSSEDNNSSTKQTYKIYSVGILRVF